MIILRLLLLLTNLHLKLLSTQGTGADKLLSTQRVNCNDSRHSCLMLIIVCHEYSMLKPIFDENVDFFSKKIILCAKGGDFNSLSAK